MASLFAVGLPFTYNGTTNHFATTTGGSATVAAVTSADTLTLDGASGTGAMTVGATFTASTITVNGTNVSLVTDGTHAFNSNGLVLLAGGTIDTTGVNMAWNSFNSSFSVGVRTLTITNSTITVNGTISVPWDLANTTSLSVNATGSTINMTGGGTNPTWREATTGGSGHTWGTLNFTGSSIPTLTAAASTFVNLGRTGTAVKTDGFNLNGGTTVTGTLTLAGNTTQGVNRLLVLSSIVASQRTIIMTGGAVVISGDVDFQDINISGSPSWTNAGSAYVGDCGGNGTLITSNTTTPATQSPGLAYLTGSYFQTPGVNLHYASTPDAAPLQITGDITLEAKIALANWGANSSGSELGIVGKWTTASLANSSYIFGVQALTGRLVMNVSNSTTNISYVATADIGLAANALKWVRVSRIASTGATSFYTSDDGTTWTQLGTTITNNAGNINGSTAEVDIGAYNTGTNAIQGAFYRAKVYNAALGTGSGTPVFDADFTAAASHAASFTESSANAATVTINQANVTWSTALWTSREPLPQDNVTIPGLTSSTLSVNVSRLGANIDFTGSTGGTWGTNSTNASLYGSLTLASGTSTMTGSTITFAGRGNFTVTTNGVNFGPSIVVNAPNGTYTFADDFISVGGANTFNNGTMTVTGNMRFQSFSFNQTHTVATVLNMGSKTWTLFGTGGVWAQFPTNFTLNSQGSTIVISDTSSASKTFGGGGFVYNNLTITGGNGSSAIISGANTFNSVAVTNPDTVLTWPSSSTNTVASFSANGQNNGYLYLNGVSASYPSAPNIAAYNITGDLDIRSQLVLDNWRPTSTLYCGPTMDAGGTNRQYSLRIVSGGFMNFYKTSTGSGTSSVSSSVAIPTSASAQWLRATWVAASGLVTFYTSPDNSTWTQLGTTTGLEAGTIFTGTAPMTIGAAAGTSIAPGQYYRLQVYNGIGGTLVYDANFTAKAFGANSFTESSANAATVTINGTPGQAGDGRVLINSSINGTKATLSSSSRVNLDYVTVQDNTAAGNTPFYAGTHGVLISGTINWLAQAAPPSGTPNMLMMGVG